MVRVLFICHGNICRSVAAEMIMRQIAEKNKMYSVNVSSAAVSYEEIGNDIYPPMRRVLSAHKITCSPHAARRMTPEDYTEYDLLIGMDVDNLKRMQRITGGDPDQKMHLLMEFAGLPEEEVSDPWYTRDFEKAYDDILRGCQGLLKHIQKMENLE